MPELFTSMMLTLRMKNGSRLYQRPLFAPLGFMPGRHDVIEICPWPADAPGHPSGNSREPVSGRLAYQRLLLGGYAELHLEPFNIFDTRNEMEQAPARWHSRDWCTETWGDLEAALAGHGWKLREEEPRA